MERTEYIYNCIINDYKNREVVIYGYSERNKSVGEFLKNRGINIAFFVDSSRNRQKIKGVYAPDILFGLSKRYYVVIPMINHEDIIRTITGLGYSSKDYAYLGNLEFKVLHNDKDYYEDTYGNIIIGEVDRSKIQFRGFDSKVSIPNDCIIGSEFSVQIRDESEVKIGKGTKINCRLVIYDKSLFQCGQNCVFSGNGLVQMFASKVIIGNYFTIEKGYTIRPSRKSSIIIGEDCMFSYNIEVRTNDGHSIFDIHSGKNINSNEEMCRNRNVKIGNHVWVGTNTLIMYNTDIADGSIIGAMSMVKSKIPNNCIAAGIPAKVIRKDIAWSRNNCAEDISECGMEYIELTRDDF